MVQHNTGVQQRLIQETARQTVQLSVAADNKNCVRQIAAPDHGYKHAPGQMAAPQKSADGSVTVETRWMEGKDNS